MIRSKARFGVAALGLGLLLGATPPARAQERPTLEPVPKFKDPNLQQYLVSQMNSIQEKLDRLSSRLDALEGQLAKVKEQQQALATDFHANQELAKATDTSVTSLRVSNQEDLLSLKTDVARIRRDVSDLGDQVRKTAAPPPAPAAPAAPAPPKIEGYITQVAPNTISINLGTAAGVEVGMKFGVYRAADPQTRIGTIEVTEVVDANNARAKIVASNPNTKFQFSDIVRPY
ncbi:MAG TPA: hypothetical protein VMV61_09260 [Patescibacteria group bacterium]|nr:hypothetical protein [Patescibacteria group bacterium]